MDKWQTFGHNGVKNVLNKQLESKIFPHAYLFTGPQEIGKKTLALEFSKKILTTDVLLNHPDFQLLDSETEISAEMMLKFLQSQSFKPFLGSKKVSIINNAQNLNKTSANSLLKTLEEPSPSTILILVASGGVLPTIVSRCQVFNFSLFNNSSLIELSEQLKLKADREIINLSFGSSGRLITLNTNESFLKDQKEIKQQFLDLKVASLGNKILKIGELAEKEPLELEKNLTEWMFLQLAELKNKPEEFLKVKAFMDAAGSLKQNFNKKLVLQGLMSKI